MSSLLKFYRSSRLNDILGWDDGRLEHTHDYIQWLFPLPEASAFNPDAPVLTAGDAAAFRASPELQARMRAAFLRMLRFYGFEPPNPKPWLTPHNHNFLRLTRILRSLRLCGLEPEAAELFAHLEATYQKNPLVIGETTHTYWRDAATVNCEL